MGFRIQPLAEREGMKALLLGLVISFASVTAQAQRAPDPLPLPQSPPAPSIRSSSPAVLNETELPSRRHYMAKDGYEPHAPRDRLMIRYRPVPVQSAKVAGTRSASIGKGRAHIMVASGRGYSAALSELMKKIVSILVMLTDQWCSHLE